MLHGKQKMRSAVGYVRVSTGKQERSGLGLEAQQAALIKFAATPSLFAVKGERCPLPHLSQKNSN